jgi:hypothetical protein
MAVQMGKRRAARKVETRDSHSAAELESSSVVWTGSASAALTAERLVERTVAMKVGHWDFGSVDTKVGCWADKKVLSSAD